MLSEVISSFDFELCCIAVFRKSLDIYGMHVRPQQGSESQGQHPFLSVRHSLIPGPLCPLHACGPERGGLWSGRWRGVSAPSPLWTLGLFSL